MAVTLPAAVADDEYIETAWGNSVREAFSDGIPRGAAATQAAAGMIGLVALWPNAGSSGTAVATTDGAGDVLVAYAGSGEFVGVPAFLAQSADPTLNQICVVHSKTGTGCKIRFRTTLDTVLVSTAVAFTWLCIGSRAGV